jgi:Uma2 family endonuclease
MVTLPHKSRQPDDSLRSPSVSVAEPLRPDLPTMYDLPSESLEEPGLPDEYHDVQPQLLSRTLQLAGYRRDNYFTVSDLNIYYDPDHKLWYERADWFLAVGVPYLYAGQDMRRSYVNWQEPQPPRVVVEFLSPGTEGDDLGRFHVSAKQSSAAAESETGLDTDTDETKREKPPSKLIVYEQYLRVPHYLVYNRENRQLRYFQLSAEAYQEQPIHASNPLVWLADLEIGLGIWEGRFNEVLGYWLRWCDRQGNWFFTDTEQERLAKEQERLAKQQAEQQAEHERQRAEHERQRAEQERLAKEKSQSQLLQAARNLLATGMPMEQVSAMLSLSAEQVEWLNQHPA